MKRLHDVALGLSTIFGINHIDNDSATQIISYCDAQSKYALHCTSHTFNKLSSYNNLSNILDRNQDALTQKEKNYALLWATQRSYYNTVKRLLESGANPNADNRLQLSPFTIAEKKKDTKIIELLKKYNCTINPECNQPPSFIIAMYTRDIPTLEQCINCSAYDPDYYIPCLNKNCKECGNILHLAAYIGDANILTILLAQPKIAAKINDKNYEKLTPYWIAEKRNYIPFMETLAACPDTDINIKNNLNHSSIAIATFDGHTTLVKLLTSHKDYQPDTVDVFGTTPLYLAVQENHIEIAKILLDDPRINVNYLCDNKFTSLYAASEDGHTPMIRLFLTHTHIQEKLTNQRTPLYAACKNGHLDCVKILCLANPDMINIPYNDNYTPICIAVKNGHMDVVQHLLSYKITDTNIKTGTNHNTLLHICALYDHPKIATLLLQHNPDLLNIYNDTNDLPLHLAAEQGSIAVVKILLQTNKCIINTLNKDNNTPLDLTRYDNIEELKELIISYGGKYGKDVQEQQTMII